MAKTLEAHDKLIREIFEGSYQFEIPDYQRPYAWTTEQAGELFDDLISAMQDARVSGATSQYFLGSIVLIKNDREPKSSVVDGQQRLSTLTMLFAVLREAMPHAADDITDFLYKKGKVSLGEKNEYRLTAREEDADFFRTNIQEPGGIAQLVASTDKLEDSRLRYRENATLLLGKAKALPPADLIALWQFLANDCSLVVISTPDLEAAYRIFSVLNNRGLDLAPIDIIKAQVLGLIRTTAGDVKSRAYAKEWSRIENALGRDAFGDLFGHIRTIYAKQKQRATLVKEFQEHVTEYKAPIDLIDKVIKPYAEVWDFVRAADFEATEHAETINEHLSWLNRVDFKDWVPPALVYFKRFRQKPKLLAEFFQSLERLTYFLLVTKVGINERIETYAALTKEIEQETFKGELAELTTLALTDAQKRKFVAALDGDVYDDLPKARMALVLRLESLVRAPGVQLQNAVSLEHVLPQTPPDGSDWLQWFPDQNEREAWTHRLANLVPLDRNKNSSASNYDFAKKKNVYFKGKGTASPFVLTQEVRSEDIWTPAMLIDRQNRLVGVLKKHWVLEVSPTESVSKAPDTTTAMQGQA
ncbi:TPA: DUF262 domain-containing protein [Stenotrophomonas maltophilia]|nr:DUF262 domain-containing protein [Stenotrophomonas maltophilia]HDS1313427.1 DUF262 domain-containing protein [Stenotrophomonas maltophilia]HDS1317073.1 DUF262 domain-containing protein [Stenotrophomonas maltophilia]HDS1442576.1 DUF262 domain-containing protein [Stenotrophomonas maltophilia]HEL3157668.1 DUF262 domain-containing protein [Stenotrophomonas maltophilia]